jgi:hypothetical protein
MPVSRNENNGQRLFSIIDIRKDLYIEEVTQDSEGNVVFFFSLKTTYQFFHRIG